MEFTELDETSGFTAGDLRAIGYFAAVPAYQQIFFCDGRPFSTDINESGYHRLDLISTSLVGEASGFFEYGEIVVQEETEAMGKFIETIGTGATAKHLVYRTTTTQFNTTDEITGQNSGTTLTPTSVVSPPHWLNWIPKLFVVGDITGTFQDGESVGQDTTGATGVVVETTTGVQLCIKPTSDVEFDVGYVITGDNSEATIDPTGVSGYFPDGGSNVARLFDGRIWLNSVYESNQWLCSRQGDLEDFNTSEDIEDVQAAFSSQTSLAGLVAQPLIDFIPYKSAYLIFALMDSMWLLTGGSTGAGQFINITTETGLFSPDSWCFDDKGNLFFIGINGFYKIPVGTGDLTVDSISNRKLPKLFKTLSLSRTTDRIAMAYDRDRNLVNITISMMDGSWGFSFCYDPTNDSIWPDSHNGRHLPSAYGYIMDILGEETGLWIGSYDGYIRKWDEEETTDDGEVIPSKVMFGPIQVQNSIRLNLKIKEIEVILTENTDSVNWALYSGDSAEQVKVNIETNQDPVLEGTFSSGGRKTIVDKISGEFIAILFSNNTVGDSWGVEKIVIKYLIAGRSK